ncbi:MAG TPA: hypothetical protein VF411_05455 [Bacteroidia bacterium]
MERSSFIDKVLVGIRGMVREFSKGYFLDFSEYGRDDESINEDAVSSGDFGHGYTSDQELQQGEPWGI